MKTLPFSIISFIVLMVELPHAGAATVLTGGSTSAIDAMGNSVPPLITETTVGGAPVYQFTTGTFADGPFISTLEFSFTPEADETNLLLHFTILQWTTDSTGTQTSPFGDSVQISLRNPTGTMTLLLVDVGGPTTDPFGTAPGPVIIGPPETFPLVFDYMFNADVKREKGVPLQLFIDIANEDDGRLSSLILSTNIEVRLYPIPEARTVVLFLALLPMLTFFRNRALP
jgi:hypothetical protein